jgi:GT2 family glycosyltransferase
MKRGYYHRIGGTEIDLGQHDDIRFVDYVEGSCLLAKADVLRKIGLLNSRYFAYWEEADLCIRGAEAGYRSIYAPRSKIWHKVSASSTSATKLYYMTRNRLWFMREHADKLDLASFYAYFFTSYFIGTVGRFLLKKDTENMVSFLRGVIDGLH